MNESKTAISPDRWKRRLGLLVPILLVLLIFTPFEIEIRLNTESYTITSKLLAWAWAYRLIDSTIGFYTPPSYWYLQQPLLYTLFQFVFLAALVGYYLGHVSKKDTMNIGLFSLVPGIFVMAVNIVIGIIVPFGTTIIAPIPLPFAPILGLAVLRKTDSSREEDSWLSKPNDV